MHRMMQKYAEFLREGRQQNPGGCHSCEEDIALRKWERACQEMSSLAKERAHGEEESKPGRLSFHVPPPVTVYSESR